MHPEDFIKNPKPEKTKGAVPLCYSTSIMSSQFAHMPSTAFGPQTPRGGDT